MHERRALRLRHSPCDFTLRAYVSGGDECNGGRLECGSARHILPRRGLSCRETIVGAMERPRRIPGSAPSGKGTPGGAAHEEGARKDPGGAEGGGGAHGNSTPITTSEAALFGVGIGVGIGSLALSIPGIAVAPVVGVALVAGGTTSVLMAPDGALTSMVPEWLSQRFGPQTAVTIDVPEGLRPEAPDRRSDRGERAPADRPREKDD
jgi:hypothetical protein